MLWRIVVNPLADSVDDPIIITGDGPINAIESLNVDPAGNCGEGIITAQAGVTPIRVRDAIQVQVWNPETVTWRSVYYGMCVGAPSAFSRDIGVYRFAGLKQRFYEVYPNMLPPLGAYSGSSVPGNDVSEMAALVANEAVKLIGAAVTYSTGLFFTAGFSLGDRAFGTQSFGEMLDALAETVGPFIAPPGGYTDDGSLVFYPAGSFVPGNRWGVLASGHVFFYRPFASPHQITESSELNDLKWLDDNGEEAVNAIRVVFAEQGPFTFRAAYGAQSGLPTSEAHVPLYQDAGVGNLGGFLSVPLATGAARKQVTLEQPVDFLDVIAASAQAFSPSVTNSGNISDGNDGTFATITQLTTIRSMHAARGIILRLLFDQTTVAAELTVSARWSLSTGDTGPWLAVTKGLRLDAESGPLGLSEALIPILLPSDIDFTAIGEAASPPLYTHVVLEVTSGIALHDLRAYGLGTNALAAATRFLGAHMRIPSDSVGTATVIGSLEPATKAARIFPADGSPDFLASVERTEYGITREDGAFTRFHVGQPFESQLVSERILLERLARRAVGRAS